MKEAVLRKEATLDGVAQWIPVVTGCRLCGLMGHDLKLRQ